MASTDPGAVAAAKRHALELVERGNFIAAWGAVAHLHDVEDPAAWTRVFRWLYEWASSLPHDPPMEPSALPFPGSGQRAANAAMRVDRARQWETRAQHGGPAGGLLDDAELQELESWFTPEVRETLGCGAPLAAFLAASRRTADADVAERAAHAAALDTERAQQRRLLASYHVAQAASELRGARGAKALVYLTAARELGAEGPSLELLAHWARRSLPRTVRHGRAHAIAWSPDGATIAIAEADGVRIWSPLQRHELHLEGSRGGVGQLAWNPSGPLLAGAMGATMQLWQARQGTLASLPVEHPGPISAIAWSPDGTMIATAWGAGQVRIWKPREPETPPVLLECEASCATLAWHPRRPWLAAGTDRGIEIYEAAGAAWRLARSLESAERILELTWNAEKGWLAARSSQGVVSWDLEGGRPSQPRPARIREAVAAMAWSPCGELLAVATDDGTVRIRKTSTDRPASPLLEHAAMVTALRWSPTAPVLAALTCDGSVQLWDTQDPSMIGRSIYPTNSAPTASAVRDGGGLQSRSPDGSVLARAEGKVVSLSAARDEESPTSLRDHREPVRAMAWSPDGEWLATLGDGGGRGGIVRLWDARAGYPLAPDLECDGEALALEWSADGGLLTAVLEDGKTAHRWPVQRDRGSLEEWREAVQAGLYRLVDGKLTRRPRSSR